MRFDLAEGFPCLTTKEVRIGSVIRELQWFLKGDTNVRWLQEKNVTIWDEWADEQGELGPVYGKQWRAWAGPDGQVVDQIQRAIDLIKNDPDSRRIIVNAWNVGELEQMALTPCHCLFQFFVAEGRLSCQLYQRSCDVGLGVPFNIASYALLTMMMAQVCNLEPGEFVWTGGDIYLYQPHRGAARAADARTPPPADYADKESRTGHLPFPLRRFYPTQLRPSPGSLKWRLPSERAHDGSYPGGVWLQQCTGRYDAFWRRYRPVHLRRFYTALPSSAPRPCRLRHGSSRKLVGGEYTRGMGAAI